jgi:Uma2 family endonuclease
MASAIVATPKPTAPPALESEALYEIVDGQRREVPPMGVLAGAIASVLAHYLNAFAIPRKLGLAVIELLCQLMSNRPQRRPDIVFVTSDQWQKQPIPGDDPPSFTGAPNLAVEVVSPTNTAQEIEDNLQDYFQAGVELVWVVYPRHRRIYVYESRIKVSVLQETDELDGGTVLPGFRLKIADLFAPLGNPN